MAIIRKKKGIEQEVEIPTASMADIAFLLIIFFMTTTIFARDKGLKLVLPEKKQEIVKLKSKDLLKISINDLDQIFVGDERVSEEELIPKVKAKLEENPKLIILVKPHVNASYEKLISVFDKLKQIKAKRVAFSVVKPTGEGQ